MLEETVALQARNAREPSVRNQYAISTQSVCNQYAISTQSVRNPDAIRDAIKAYLQLHLDHGALLLLGELLEIHLRSRGQLGRPSEGGHQREPHNDETQQGGHQREPHNDEARFILVDVDTLGA